MTIESSKGIMKNTEAREWFKKFIEESNYENWNNSWKEDIFEKFDDLQSNENINVGEKENRLLAIYKNIEDRCLEYFDDFSLFKIEAQKYLDRNNI